MGTPGVRIDKLALGRVLGQVGRNMRASGIVQPRRAPACEARNSDLCPFEGWVRTRRCRTGRKGSSDLLFRQIGEADRLARIDQRVLADEVLDFGLGALVERVIGGAHIAERQMVDVLVRDAGLG
jgi:hypothetical protein